MSGTALPSQPKRRLSQGPLLPIVSLLAVFVLWQILAYTMGENTSGDRTVPSLPDIVGSFERFADYWKGGLGVERTSVSGNPTFAGAVLGFFYSALLTAMHAVAGVVLGICTGLLLAVAVSWSSVLRGMLAFPGHFARMLPLLAMAPLFALWFGDTHKGAILFVAFTGFSLVFPIALNAIGNVPAYYEQYARTLGAGPVRSYFEVVLPAAMREIRSAVMLAVGFSWTAAIVAEYIGHDYGLGYVVKNAEFFGRTDLLALVATIALGLAAASFALARLVLDWSTRWAD